MVQARPKRWLTPVVLVLLKEETSYGYELMGLIEEEFGFEQINPGSVYMVLRQMENEGLCSSVWDYGRERRREEEALRVGCTPSPTLEKRTWKPGQGRARSTTSS